MKPGDDIASRIDHTLLKANATEDEIRNLCREAREYGFAAVCVNPVWVNLCRQLLQDTGVMVATVVGFPLGTIRSEAKAEEAAQAVAGGADELDMVMNPGFLKSGRDAEVEEDVRGVVQAAGGKTVKVIIETALLTDEEKVKACRLARQAGAHLREDFHRLQQRRRYGARRGSNASGSRRLDGYKGIRRDQNR